MAPGNPLLLGVLLSQFFVAVSVRADWPGWRGAQRDGHTRESFPASLPSNARASWKLSIGHGYSAPVVSGETLVYLDEQEGSETAHAVDRKTGAERWKTAFARTWSDEFEPGPRCTPLIDGDRVYVQSAQGTFACLALADGRRLWGLDFKDLGMRWITERGSNIGASVRRGHTGSPVIDGKRIFLQTSATGGKSIVALDKETGTPLWQALDDHTSYSSPIVATLAGRRQFVTATANGLLGLDVATGGILWRTPFQTGANRNVLTPIAVGDDVIFASHTTGLRCQRIAAEGSAQKSTERWFNRQLRINLPTPVVAGTHLFGVGASRDFVCVDLDSGTTRWSEGGFGEVASVITDGKRLLVQMDTGEVRLIEAKTDAYHESGRFQACGKTFTHPAWSDGILYVRDPQSLTAWPLATRP